MESETGDTDWQAGWLAGWTVIVFVCSCNKVSHVQTGDLSPIIIGWHITVLTTVSHYYTKS